MSKLFSRKKSWVFSFLMVCLLTVSAQEAHAGKKRVRKKHHVEAIESNFSKNAQLDSVSKSTPALEENAELSLLEVKETDKPLFEKLTSRLEGTWGEGEIRGGGYGWESSEYIPAFPDTKHGGQKVSFSKSSEINKLQITFGNPEKNQYGHFSGIWKNSVSECTLSFVKKNRHIPRFWKSIYRTQAKCVRNGVPESFSIEANFSHGFKILRITPETGESILFVRFDKADRARPDLPFYDGAF